VFFYTKGETESLKGYDKFLHSSVFKFADSCDELEGMKNLGKLVLDTFEGIRYVIVLSTRAKAPDGDLTETLMPYLSTTQDAVKAIQGLRLDRKFDNHLKAVVEMLHCVSWVYCQSPKAMPSGFVKECIGSSDFWSNRVRKEYKGKDEKQILWCDNLKTVLQDLATYITEYHKTGLCFNPKGVSVAEAAVRLTDNPISDAAAMAAEKKGKRTSLGVVQGGNVLGLMSELSSRKNEDGSSAATGLKHVSCLEGVVFPCPSLVKPLRFMCTHAILIRPYKLRAIFDSSA
jgi:hypothetical protein